MKYLSQRIFDKIKLEPQHTKKYDEKIHDEVLFVFSWVPVTISTRCSPQTNSEFGGEQIRVPRCLHKKFQPVS